VLVEWADRAPAYLAGLAWGGIIWVEITIVGQEEREVSLEMRQLDPAGHSPHGWEDA
jgi:hypothetical protein